MEELIKTQMNDLGKSRQEIMKKWINDIPLGRLGRPQELANLVVFLASDKANYITGVVVQVYGGFVKSSL